MREHARDVVSRAVAAIHCELIDGQLPEHETAEETQAFDLPQLIQNLTEGLRSAGPRDGDAISVVIPKSADASKTQEATASIGRTAHGG